MRLFFRRFGLSPTHEAKDSRLPATALLLFYLGLVLASFIAFSAGSMTAFWDIRNSFSDLWDSVYYACQKSGYTYFRIIYPPFSSLVLRLFGATISGCHEVLASRGLTLIIYGFIFFLILFLPYFFCFRSILSRSWSGCNGWQVAELCALTWMLPPSLFGLTRMNTSMLLVPVSMFLFLQVRRQAMPLFYTCLALLPFIKPFFLIPVVLYLLYTFSFLQVLQILVVYSLGFYFFNMLIFSLLDFSGGYHSWFDNIRLFNSAVTSDSIAAYYSYQPLATSYLSSRFFVDAFMVHPWLATPYHILVYSLAYASFGFALYVGIHIVRTGLALCATPRILRDPYNILLFVFLAGSYFFQCFSTSIGAYCLSLMTPVMGALFVRVDVSRYRYLCCFLVAVSLLPLLPLEIFAFTPKFPTILLFDYLLLLVSGDVRRLSIASASAP